MPQGDVTNTLKGVWELEDGSRVIDPIQVVAMKKPAKILFLLKAKAESPSLPNKIIVKSLEIDKGKFKYYEIDKVLPTCKFSSLATFIPAMEASIRTNYFFVGSIGKSDQAVVSSLVCIKIGNTGLEVVDTTQINTLKFGNIYSIRAISKDKTDFLAVGGNKSVVTVVFKENKFSLMQEFINIHSGPVIDTIFSKFYLTTASHKDHFIQMLGAEELSDNNLSMNLKNRLEFIVPKLKSDYDCWSIKSIPLPSTNFTTFEVSSDHSTAYLGSFHTPGLMKLNLSNPSSTSTILPDKKVSSIFSTGKNFVIANEEDRQIQLLLGDFSEISSIKGAPLKVQSKGTWANLKHFNADDVTVWMKENMNLIQVTSDNLAIQNLPPLEILDSHVLVSCAASNSMSVIGMYLRNLSNPKEDVIISIKNFETVHLSKVTMLLPNSRIFLTSPNSPLD